MSCGQNKLNELDLSNVPNLTRLRDRNQLAELDLASAPRLTTLYCNANQISELDFASVPNLTRLHCENNLITKLDVTANTALTELRCDLSVRVVKLPSQNLVELPNQNFRQYSPRMRYWFDEARNEVFPMAELPFYIKGCVEITERNFKECEAFARAKEAKGMADDDE